MAASLLIMVCDITAKSRKHTDNRTRLRRLSRNLAIARDRLIALAPEDARAYDLVLAAIRRARKEGKTDSQAVRRAVIYAAKIPMKTANLCIDVLESGIEVAEKGKVSASSDVGVGLLLAHAGYAGAAMNVRINLVSLRGLAFASETARKLSAMDRRAEKLTDCALKTLRSRTK